VFTPPACLAAWACFAKSAEDEYPSGNVATVGSIPRFLHSVPPDTLTCRIFKTHGGLPMSQLEQDKLQQRVHLGALVDREQRDELVRRAQQEDRSVSAELRRAIDKHLEQKGQ
jgi:hypothetical protein